MPVTEGLTVKGGYITTIVLQSEILDSTESIRGIDIKKRHCYFEDEQTKDSMFQTYSQKKCLFECLWKQALDYCGCIPWKYPRPDKEDGLVCNIYGNVCWQEMFESGKAIINCSCPPDCSKTSYTYFTNIQELKAADCVSKTSYFQCQFKNHKTCHFCRLTERMIQ